MRRLAWLAALIAAPLLSIEPVTAQATRADTAAVLLDVATRLRQEGRATLSRSLLDLIADRYAGTPAADAAQRLRAAARGDVEERSGRTELLVWSTAYGLALGGAVPAAFEAHDPEVYGVGLLVGGPAGFFLGRALTKRPLTEGQARAISFGSLWGAWQGLGWRDVLGIGDPEPFCDPNYPDLCFQADAESSTVLKATILGSLAGVGTGLYLARKDIPSGTATTVSLGALWGTWFGVAGAVLVDAKGEDETLTWSLIGGDAGLVATALLAPKWKLSRNRARLISIAGVAGGLAGAGVMLISNAEDNEAILFPLLGSVAGLGLGTYWTRTYDERGPTRGGEGGSGSALLEVRDGAVKVGAPVPLPMLLRNGHGAQFTPGVHVPIFQARF